MKYITFNEIEQQFELTGERPNNQNTSRVRNKIKNRLKKLAITPNTQLTNIQNLFVQGCEERGKVYKISQDDINIAHNISISGIMKKFADMMNDAATSEKTVEEFVSCYQGFFESILSTSEEDSSTDSHSARNKKIIRRKDTKEFLSNLKEQSAIDSSNKADEIISHLNQCSRNLYPGGESENKAISQHRDPPFVLTTSSKLKKIPAAENINEGFIKSFGHLGITTECEPKKNPEGQKLSSSLAGELFKGEWNDSMVHPYDDPGIDKNDRDEKSDNESEKPKDLSAREIFKKRALSHTPSLQETPRVNKTPKT